jgi:hypothetical protein
VENASRGKQEFVKEYEMVKSILAKVLFGVGTVLLVCFLGGLVYIHYDYYTNTLPSYASYPISVPILIHGVIFLVPSILCFIMSLILRSKVKNKS